VKEWLVVRKYVEFREAKVFCNNGKTFQLLESMKALDLILFLNSMVI